VPRRSRIADISFLLTLVQKEHLGALTLSSRCRYRQLAGLMRHLCGDLPPAARAVEIRVVAQTERSRTASNSEERVKMPGTIGGVAGNDRHDATCIHAFNKFDASVPAT
jgi:hypothetical protein